MTDICTAPSGVGQGRWDRLTSDAARDRVGDLLAGLRDELADIATMQKKIRRRCRRVRGMTAVQERPSFHGQEMTEALTAVGFPGAIFI